MDGTLLDLRFDNWFWQEHVPAVYAAAHGLEPEAALAPPMPRFAAARGRLDWYCIDYWSRELGLDIRAIKRGVREQVAWIPGAEAFLVRLRALGKRRVLLTNAHPETLAIKDEHVDLVGHLDPVYSTIRSARRRRTRSSGRGSRPRRPSTRRARCSSMTACRCWRAARDYGIAWLRAIRRPIPAGRRATRPASSASTRSPSCCSRPLSRRAPTRRRRRRRAARRSAARAARPGQPARRAGGALAGAPLSVPVSCRRPQPSRRRDRRGAGDGACVAPPRQRPPLRPRAA